MKKHSKTFRERVVTDELRQAVFNYVVPKHGFRDHMQFTCDVRQMQDFIDNGFDEVVFDIVFQGDKLASTKPVSGEVLITDANGVVHHHPLEVTNAD